MSDGNVTVEGGGVLHIVVTANNTFLRSHSVFNMQLIIEDTCSVTAVELSVEVSVTFVNCLKTNKHIIKFFSPIILVF